jgi:hypothetical protein
MHGDHLQLGYRTHLRRRRSVPTHRPERQPGATALRLTTSTSRHPAFAMVTSQKASPRGAIELATSSNVPSPGLHRVHHAVHATPTTAAFTHLPLELASCGLKVSTHPRGIFYACFGATSAQEGAPIVRYRPSELQAARPRPVQLRLQSSPSLLFNDVYDRLYS